MPFSLQCTNIITISLRAKDANANTVYDFPLNIFSHNLKIFWPFLSRRPKMEFSNPIWGRKKYNTFHSFSSSDFSLNSKAFQQFFTRVKKKFFETSYFTTLICMTSKKCRKMNKKNFKIFWFQDIISDFMFGQVFMLF